MDPGNVPAKFEVRIALPVPEIIGDILANFGQSLGTRSSKVIDFGTKRKRVCDFLLVRHTTLGPIFYRFRDIAGFCAAE